MLTGETAAEHNRVYAAYQDIAEVMFEDNTVWARRSFRTLSDRPTAPTAHRDYREQSTPRRGGWTQRRGRHDERPAARAPNSWSGGGDDVYFVYERTVVENPGEGEDEVARASRLPSRRNRAHHGQSEDGQQLPETIGHAILGGTGRSRGGARKRIGGGAGGLSFSRGDGHEESANPGRSGPSLQFDSKASPGKGP